MKASALIELLRDFDIETEVCIDVGFNLYEVGRDITFDPKRNLIVIKVECEDVNNEIGQKK